MSTAAAAPTALLTMIERLTEVAFTPYECVDDLARAILALLADVLDVGLTFLSRVDGDDLVIVSAYDRADMGLQAGDVIPLCDTYCQTLLTRASRWLVVEDARTDAHFAALATTRALGIGAYAGVPLYRSTQTLYGTLCTLNPAARAPAPGDCELLALAGRIIMRAIEAEEGRQREQALRATLIAEQRMHDVYAAMTCGVVVFDATGQFTDANAAACDLLGITPGAVGENGRSFADVITLRENGSILPPDQRPSARALRTGQAQRNVTIGCTRRDGAIKWLQSDAVPVFDGEGALTHVVTSYLDVTDRRNAERQLAHQATHDALTDLPNRLLLQQRLTEAVQRHGQTGQVAALLLLDLDRFKEINDTFGHLIGDWVLQQVAARLREGVRATDTVARLGGDEFAVLLPATDAAGALCVARTIRTRFDPPVTVGEHRFFIGGSIGIALLPAHGDDGETLLRHVDVAMYEAKRSGSGVALYDVAIDPNRPERLSLVADLVEAIAEGGLMLHYQPQAAIATGNVSGVEALVRWPHRERGLIPPDEFIPLAERTGLITHITRWVLETALRDCQEWGKQQHDLSVSVNLSVWDMHDPQFPDTVAALLARYGIAPDRLRLEITEREFMSDVPTARRVLERLRALGVCLAIDDFGTGYSSLAYLNQLPADELKIDQSFIRPLATDARTGAIVQSIIDLGRNVGMTVVAEGVESATVWAQLQQMGCAVAQGYYVSRPLPAAALTDWLAARGQPEASCTA